MIEYNNTLSKYIQKKRTRTNDFTIISNDCWGAEVYRYLGLQYNTPFVGLFVMAPCYIKLLQHFEQNMQSDMSFVNESKYEQCNTFRLNMNKHYPIGVLNDDIEIHFLHYTSNDEALEHWTTRRGRINFNRLYIKFDCGKDLCNIEHLKAFENLPFEHKICLSPQQYSQFPSTIYIKKWEADGAKMFIKTMKQFDVIGWINNRIITNGFLYRIVTLFLR